MKREEDLKILYMQIRKDEETRKQEMNAFLEFSKLKPEQFTVWNVFDEPNFDISQMDDHDALFVGGSSDDPSDNAQVDRERFPFIDDAIALFRKCKDESRPVFASCMGCHIIAQTFDVGPIFDYENIEMGFSHIKLTEAAKNDVLFKDIEDGFPAVSCHKKRTIEVPEGAVLLAYTEKCPVHAYTFPGQPFYAFQFHPEFSDTALIEIFERYKDRYPGGEETLQHMKDTQEPTTSCNGLVRKFIDRILLEKAT